MPNNILVFTGNDVCLVKTDMESWEHFGMSIYKTGHFGEAVKELKTGRYVLLVISLNRDNAMLVREQLRVLRGISNIPIAVIAEEAVDVTVKIAAINNGADQIWQLPLSPEEAHILIFAMIRRFTDYNNDNIPVTVYFDHGVIVSPSHRKAFVDGKMVELTKTEFDFLCLLIRNHGIVLTYDQILEKVWGSEYISNSKDIVWSIMRKIRRKIQTSPDLPEFIRTVREIGYSFDPKHKMMR